MTFVMILVTEGAYAQSNIFNSNDTVKIYNPADPPAIPPANIMAKWVKTTTRITWWDTNKFKPYIWNGMAFRLRFPNGYNPADTTKKYPVILFLHGAGEIKNIYDNEDQLYWGAQTFQAKIDAAQFNAFLLFPQVSATAWDYTYYTRINSVLDSMQKYVKSDPDKVIAMGLSNGAYGSLSYASSFPQRVSTVIASSPALIELVQPSISSVIHIPTWLASGGLDNSPGPVVMNTYTDTFASKGGDIRYTFYPALAHGTWTAMWDEPYLVPYWNNAHTANPIIFNKKSQFCENAVAAKMGITQGFAEYQWQVNGVTIPGATTNDIIGTQLGSYRARFRRTAGGAWSDWSLVAAVITALPTVASPPISITGVRSVLLPAPDGSTTTPLELPAGYASYEWRKVSDSSVVSTARTYAAPVGQYFAKATNCNSTFSPSFNIISEAGTPKPDSARNLTLTRTSSTGITLNWTDVTGPVYNETGFEIYRALKAGGPYTMAGMTGADVKTFSDTAIAPNYNFYYRIRAVNATGAAGLSNEASLQPSKDSIAPTTPTNLRVTFTSRNYIDLEWTASADSVGVTAYDIYVNGTKKYTSTVAKITADSLTANTSYTFSVVARDQAGNISGISTSATGISKINGLKYHYYEGNWSVLPDFTILTAVASGQTPNTDIAIRPAGVTQNYGFLWEGFISIKVPGAYTFETVSDDGSKLYFNVPYSPASVALVNNDGIHGAVPVTGTVNIPDTGLHQIAVTYFQQASGQSMQLYWTGPGITRQLIPNAAFTENFAGVVDTTAPTAPSTLKSAYTSLNFIDLSWNASTDNIGVTGYDVYINNVKKYTTAATAITADSLLPNIAYTFFVKARDFAGNTSAAGNALTVTTAATALKYKYYEGNWSVLPNFSALTPVKTGASPNVDISVRPAGVTQNYGFVWEGYINIKSAGSYTFETASDDGSKFYYNTFYSPSATALVSNDGIHGAVPSTGTVNIPDTGLHPIAITYFQQGSGQSMQIYWTGPGISRQLIPDVAFTQSSVSPADSIAPTVPTNVSAAFIGSTSVDLKWTASTDNIGVLAYDVYVGGIKKYTSATTSVTADSLVTNTTYSFTVKARDLAGNTSAASTAFSAKTTSVAAGLNYKFYQGAWSMLPDFSTLTPAKSGTSANVDISVRTPGIDDNFGFVWQGYINIPAPGAYTFETVSDDGSKLYFNSSYIPTANATVNNDGLHGATTVTGTVNVATAGYYPIAITYFEFNGGQSMQVYWSGPGITRQLISDSAFFTALPQIIDTLPPSVPANMKIISVSQNLVSLHWNIATDNIGVVAYDIYRDGVKKYTTNATDLIADSLAPTTSYSFSVKARDLAGNISAASASVPATTINSTSFSGLNYRYYEGVWDVLPNFNTLTPVKTGNSVNVDLAVRNKADSFGIVWEGFINIPTAGSYTFETLSNEGSKLYFNSLYAPAANALVSNDSLHLARSASGTLTVSAAGSYPIAISYFDKTGTDSMKVYWSGPNITRQLIPNAAFTPAGLPPADTSAPTAPTNLAVATIGTTSIGLIWTASADNIGVVAYDIYVGGIKKYTGTSTNITADSLIAGTTYSFTIKARDLAGNTSQASAALMVTTTAAPVATAGLNYKFYQGIWSVLPNFNLLTPVKTGNSPNVDISVRTPGVDDNFGFVWEGYINLPVAGTYTFETISDDGSKLYFNSLYSPSATATVNNDGLHAATSVTGTATVATAGYYPIAVTYIERDGGQSMQVYWSGPGVPRQLIPNAAFASQLPADTIAPGVPLNVTATLINSTFINLSWTASTDNVGIAGYDVYVNGIKKYSTATNSITADTLVPGTSYVFTVKARDFAGNTSAFSTALTTSTTSTTQGLTYKYYEGNWDVLPNFSALTPVKTGIVPNIDIITARNQADYYGFLWEGTITLPTAGTYTFETISDDGSRFYFNKSYSSAATALVNNDGVHGMISATGSISMAAGVYPVAITFFEKNSGEGMQLYWTGPGIARQLIPNEAFTGTYTPAVDNVAPGVPANVKAILTTNTFVDIAWDASTDNVGVSGYDVYVNSVKQATVTNTLYRLSGLTAGQSSTFTIKAFDLANNMSAFSTALAVVSAPKANGLKYRYYEGVWNALPDFTSLTPVKTGLGPTADISVRPSGVNDNFAFVWEGYINITTPGTYTFETISDDGSKFYWNTLYNPAATALVNNDGLHGPSSVTGTVNIPTAGLYPIAITYFEKDGGESMQVYYSGPGIARQLLPGSAVGFTGDAPVTQAIAALTTINASSPDNAVNARITKAFPNPFFGNLTVQYFGVTSSNKVSVGVYDMSGRMVLRQLFGNVSQGLNTFNINLNKQMMPGLYLIKLDVDGKQLKIWKMIKEKR